ncbi:MAG: YggS family pyridoxal phosphate-dependent enzyme [Pseudomonadota bacterium]
MSDTCATYRAVIRSLEQTAAAAGRAADEIELLAVSKRQSVTSIRELAACGQNAFGENYLQEAQNKIRDLSDLSLSWHFIGPLQSNKAQEASRLFDWVHSVDREKIATKLNAGRASMATPLNVCIQVNISEEKTKSGVPPSAVGEFVRIFDDLPNLKLRGLMALPAPNADPVEQRAAFASVRELYTETFASPVDTLSIGTSQDYRAAIQEGATIVRIGTALFGER